MVCLFVLLGTGQSISQQLHTHSNAVSIDNETDTTSGWSTPDAILTSDFTDPFHGTYALRAESTGVCDGCRRFQYGFSAIIGEIYDISIWAKSGTQSVDPAFAAWNGVTGFTDPTQITPDGTWTEYNFTVTATTTSPIVRIYTGSSTQGSTGDVIYIDRVTILRRDTESPTSPTLSLTGKTDTSVSLSWTGSTDDTGVMGYKIFKDGNLETTQGNTSSYEVTGLTAATNYDFTITAFDAAGNESPVSNEISVTTDSIGGSVWTETGGVASYNGGVAIGNITIPSGYNLAVGGKLIAEEVRVQLSGVWPDYVFKDDYDLLSLKVVKNHIQTKGHLHNMPSAYQLEMAGLELGEMSRLLLEKIEELFLHVIELKEENLAQREQLEALERQLKCKKR